MMKKMMQFTQPVPFISVFPVIGFTGIFLRFSR